MKKIKSEIKVEIQALVNGHSIEEAIKILNAIKELINKFNNDIE